MSGYLWKAYYDDDVEAFRQLLEASAQNARLRSARGGGGGGGGNAGAVIGSPGLLSSSPTLSTKARKTSSVPLAGHQASSLTKADINWRDAHGLTLLHHAASSAADSALEFAGLLVEQSLIDLYVQDYENNWTALHRAFYFGNVAIARLILERDAGDALGSITGQVQQTIGLIKIKDKEGHGPLDLFAATIKDRTLRPQISNRTRSGSAGSEEDLTGPVDDDEARLETRIAYRTVNGNEVFTFGSNQNVTLGFGDEDDRQFPERITLRRPEHLLRRFYKEHLRSEAQKWTSHDSQYESKVGLSASVSVDEIPWVVRSRPLVIQDALMSKLHTAVLTTDPESNLYMCGHGQGGRLGVGDERTRFHFVCVEGGALAGKKVACVALGQNHTLAVSEQGEIFSWGNNVYGQLGYSLPKSSNKEDPISVIPRQIFGPLKREATIGVAASRIHSVAFTMSSLYTFGKNEGQLGIVDSDARSLEFQVTPRKVAASLFSSNISAASANESATVCLLENHDVWVFANYGYARVQFPLDGFSNYFLRQSFLVTTYDNVPNHIMKVTSAGETICALSSKGEVYTVCISKNLENQASTSTTNPSKIRSAITTPQRIWSPKKGSMAARDVGIDADGSIILSTEEGSVWKRTKRAKLKNATASGAGENKPKDYKFSRVPGLTRILAVRASAYGAYAAVKNDCDVTKTQIVVEDQSLWKSVFSLLSLKHISRHDREQEDPVVHRFWQGKRKPNEVQLLKQAIIESEDIEADFADLASRCFTGLQSSCDAIICTSTSDLVIPVHCFVLTARSKVLRQGLRHLGDTSTFTIPDLLVSEVDSEGRAVIKFHGIDALTIVNLVLYLYTDSVIDFWHISRKAPSMAFRFRQIRTELMKLSSKLELTKLEPAVRQMTEAQPCLDLDMEIAFQDPTYFLDGDVVVELEDAEVQIHGALVCARCPFFEGLFMGRAGGRWLTGRESGDRITVDLKHVNRKIFSMVLRHIYADTGEELFDDVVSNDLDGFIDVVLDVLSCSNELMLDRLSQICQQVIGRFVNVRNVCWLLNAISPSSVHEFKDAGLEYICLSLEAMLQGHHLNELDEDLQLDLDEVIRQNQLAGMPFAKSGRAEALLHERNPQLAAMIVRSRQSKVDAAMLRTKFSEMEVFKAGSLEDDCAASPMLRSSRRKSSQAHKAETPTPALKPKASSKDMMFIMDEEATEADGSVLESPSLRPQASFRSPSQGIASSMPDDTWYNSKGKQIASPPSNAGSPLPKGATPKTPRSPPFSGRTPPNGSAPWGLSPLPGAKVDIKDLFVQGGVGRSSSLSQALASAKASASTPVAKMSQKERKRMQQTQAVETQAESALSQPELPKVTIGRPTNPWQTVIAQKVPSLKDMIDKQHKTPSPPVTSSSQKPSGSRAMSTPQLTMRQTVANPKPEATQKQVIGPAGQSTLSRPAAPDHKSATTPPRPKPTHAATQPATTASGSGSSKPIPHSIRHQPRPVEPSLQLSMSDILAQQQAEKDIVKEAVAKRDLQDIQAEQEFQEWWDKESARVQEAERKHSGPPRPLKKSKGRGGGRVGRGGGRGSKSAAQDDGVRPVASSSQSSKQ
ncbi:hypothetical protein K431DRAFT_289072 [Polychaeton citri CBS 116435]|uniref:BTB domain-containing protein n=1 Tax=Polychaeton citri CBS 116435 TaxID=1314669 RepID=A0A9P4Q1V9_9PEZI|nr:hypothetical protein K431DRAFT_289072 [Polychaeton citri CBS 116435]